MRKKKLTALYAITQFAYWMGFASVSAFASMYLLGFEVSNSMIGTVIAVSNLMTAILQPFFGTLSDKHAALSARRLLGIFMILVIAMSVVLLCLKNSAILVICLIYGICFVSMSVAQPFLNALAMQYMNVGYSLNFGISRAVGSLGYALIAYLLGRLADLFGIRVIPMAFITAFGMLFITLFLYPQIRGTKQKDLANGGNSNSTEQTGDVTEQTGYVTEQTGDATEQTGYVTEQTGDVTKLNGFSAEQADSRKSGGSFFGRYPYFAIMLAGLVCVYFGHMVINSFTLQIVESIGGGNTEMGTATSVAAMVEILTMLVFSNLMKKVPLTTLLRISVIFFTLKIMITMFVSSISAFYLIQLMQMPGWGIMAVGLVYYVNEIMAPEDCTKGQAYATMSYAIGCIAAAWSGGILLDWMGVRAMLLCGTIVSAIGACIFIFGNVKQKSVTIK